MNALLVALGILLSRIAGLIRDRAFAHFFGNSMAADAFRAAFRIPNLLQNLFGEGALSASFIPVYARLRAEGQHEAARVVASGIAATLALVVSVIVLVGVLGAPVLVTAIAPGFAGETRALTVRLVRVLFPGAGLLVFAAWCLGILNSHRQFFLSYVAPVFWNAVIVAALLFYGRSHDQASLGVIAAWAAVVGSAVQLAIQLPGALRLTGRLRLGLFWSRPEIRTVMRNFLPAFVSRGVFQISAFIDSLLASLLPTGALAAMTYAQTLYVLPVSLFGMAVSASELPEMSSATGTPAEVADKLRQRLNSGLSRIVFFVLPSMIAFIALGDVVVGAIYQTGRFGPDDVRYVWATLAGISVGLLAATQGRLYSSAFYALGNTRTPLHYAVIHVAIAAGLGAPAARFGPGLVGVDPRYGVVGITLCAAFGAWVEYALLRASLAKRIGKTGVSAGVAVKVLGAALAAAALALGTKSLLPPLHPILGACAILGVFGVSYIGQCVVLRVEQASDLLHRLVARIRR